MAENFIDELTWRGLVQDYSDLDAIRKLGPGDAFYVGYDPTAPSFHLGNLVGLMVMVHLGRAGLKPICLFGGATGSIGDPSGKSAERNLMTQETIDENVRNQSAQVEQLFSRIDLKPTFVNNYDWTHSITFTDFLRDVGKHFPVNYMLAKETVKTRLEGSGISFTEFCYMLLQANDFLHLFLNFNCKLQMGGSDQWGNITAGLELIRRKGHDGAEAFSHPLITNSQGKKFGKSEEGAVWLDPTLTSPYKLHQFLLNSSDEDVIHYLKIFTFLTQEEIQGLEDEMKSSPEKRSAQKALADSVCELVHGADSVLEANRSAEVLFGGSLDGVSEEQLEEIFSDVPSSQFSQAELNELDLLELLVRTDLVASRGDGKRLIKSGGIYINNERVSDSQQTLLTSCKDGQRVFILRSGKKKYHLLKVSDDS